jgi:hypothetical protein
MAMGSTGKIVGSVTSMVVGGVIAAVTIVGIVSHSVNSSSDKPGNLNNATIPYGTTQ